MRSLAFLLPTLLLLPAFAGCISSPEAVDAASLSPDGLAAAAAVSRFTGAGEPLPLPDAQELGAPWFKLTGEQGAEPNMGITSSGAIFVTAGDQVLRSRDAGESWESVYDFGLAQHGAPVDPVRNSDPMLWVDPWTDRVYSSPMFPALACTTLAWSEDEGETWTERHGTCHTPPMDHQKLGGGPVPADAPPVAGVAHETILYQCYNMLLSTNCAVSYDGGLNFLPAVPVIDGFRHDCGGLNGMPVAHEDGTVVVGSASGCAGVAAAFSEDGGVTWRVSQGPTDHGAETNDPEFAWTPDGTLYMMWAGNDHVTYLARTSDKGGSWDGPWRVTPPDVTSTVWPVLSAGDDGRIAMAFVGTRDTDSDPSDAPDETRWHLFVVTSDDADADEPTFTGYQVTPDEDPVQVGCIWMRGFPGAPCRNLLDFIDSAVAPDGTFHVVYAEGCTQGCAGNPDAKPEDSRDRIVSLARLDGWSLHAATSE